MTTYPIEVSPQPRQALHTLGKPTRRRIQHAIDALADQPHPPDAIPLTGTPGRHRLRAGTHQILYAIRENAVLILDIAHTNSPWGQPTEPATP